jgi:hypothetical protein
MREQIRRKLARELADMAREDALMKEVRAAVRVMLLYSAVIVSALTCL